MNYVESFNLFGTKAAQIPCIKGSIAPTTSTPGAVGCLYMDTAKGDIYKCVSVSENQCTWESLTDNSTALDRIIAIQNELIGGDGA